MSEKNRGNVVPFAVPTSRLRRSAADYMRKGRPVDAVERLRQAAQREDRTYAWLDLAEGLYALACYEQAAAICYRMLAREDVPLDAWMLLARCQKALGRREGAADSLYHCLSAEPFGPVSDVARELLAEVEDASQENDAYRLPKLIRRGLTAWRAGDRETGRRRLHRAARMASNPVRLRITIALLMLSEGENAEALRELALALRRSPGDPRAMTALCAAYSGLGKRRVARGLLDACARVCVGPENEELFLTAAWMLDVKKAQRQYLTQALRRTPCRIALMYPLAASLASSGRMDQARRLWERVLRIEPGEMRARVSLDWTQAHPGETLPEDGGLPAEEIKLRLMALARAVTKDTPCAELLRQGSQTRMLADWCFTLRDEGLQRAVLHSVSREDGPAVRAYLRELLTCPTVAQGVREEALVRLESLGAEGPFPMLMGAQMTLARSAGKEQRRSRWAVFLAQFLEETGDHGQSMPMAFYAADEWRQMDRRQHRNGAGADSYSFVKAIEILYLRETGQEEAAYEVVRRMDVSRRRIERVLRGLAPRHTLLKGED